jgi:hypothetical protein
MKKMAVAVILIVMSFGTIAVCDAREADRRGGIPDRIDVEYERIERGVERGALTRPEAHRLRGELKQILYKIDRMKRDGYLDPREREIINRKLDRLDRDITREKKDSERRPRY